MEQQAIFLAEASCILLESLDYRVCCLKLVEMICPAWADYCAIDVVDKDSKLHRVAEKKRSASGVQPSRISLDAHGRTWGVLSIHFIYPDLSIIRELAYRIALSIERNWLYQEAKDAVELREHVLAIVSHDLKNPLSTIVLNASLLDRIDCVHPNFNEKKEKYLETIRRSTKQMRRLIADLLDFAKVNGGQLTLDVKNQSVKALLEEVIEIFEPIASEKRINLIHNKDVEDCTLTCDHDRMLQVFSNLIDNAIKFSPEGSQVHVEKEHRGKDLVFSIRDRGPGIKPEDLPHVFEKFWQARKTQNEGSGIGLSITRGLVEAHGGQVWVESVWGGGSTFYVMLPIAHCGKNSKVSAA